MYRNAEKIEVMKKADVYSFGIVMHEIFAREGPYGDELKTAEGMGC